MIFLYHKRHKVTGLNYFGKTTSDPYLYCGSGKYWTDHLDKHGHDIETIQVWQFEDQTACTDFAISFSKENDIVNQKTADGKKVWANLKVENGSDGGFDDLRWYSKGKESVLSAYSPGDDWILGRAKKTRGSSGYKWYNNGKENLLCETPPLDKKWVPGIIREKRTYKSRECPICSFVGGGSSMSRYHFENCKGNTKISIPGNQGKYERIRACCIVCRNETTTANINRHHIDCKRKAL